MAVSAASQKARMGMGIGETRPKPRLLDLESAEFLNEAMGIAERPINKVALFHSEIFTELLLCTRDSSTLWKHLSETCYPLLQIQI